MFSYDLTGKYVNECKFEYALSEASVNNTIGIPLNELWKRILFLVRFGSVGFDIFRVIGCDRRLIVQWSNNWALERAKSIFPVERNNHFHSA